VTLQGQSDSDDSGAMRETWLVRCWFDEGDARDEEPGPLREVQAANRDEAIDAYNALMGRMTSISGYSAKPKREWTDDDE
jgi:hypothetical protein